MNVDKDDGELAARALTGEHAAFGRLTRRDKEPLYRLLRRLTGADRLNCARAIRLPPVDRFREK